MKSHHYKSKSTLSQKKRIRKTLTTMCNRQDIKTKEVAVVEVAEDTMGVEDSEVGVEEVVLTKMDVTSILTNLGIITQGTTTAAVEEVVGVQEDMDTTSTVQILTQAIQTLEYHPNHESLLAL